MFQSTTISQCRSATIEAESVKSALDMGRKQLPRSKSASLDAQMLLGHVLRKPRWWILAQGDHRLDRSEYQEFCALISRRAEGEPVAYLRERVEWADLELKVTPDVLIPRPETELLVDRAVQLARRRGATVLADIGTGSAAISIRLARCLPETQVFAVDVSTKALSVAKTNVQTYHV